MTIVLGYNGGIDGYPADFGANHNSAAAIVVDGVVVAACEEERFSRRKHDGSFPRLAIDWCLKEAGIKRIEDLDLVTYFYRLGEMFHPGILAQNKSGMNAVERLVTGAYLLGGRTVNRLWGYSDARSKEAFERELRCNLRDSQYYVVPHHLCHVASAFYDSPFERALCVTFDGQGESVCSIVVRAQGTRLETIAETYIPNSLGYLYSFVTIFLGFDVHDEYKVMGLAPYGRRGVYRSFFDGIIRKLPGGKYAIDQGALARMIITQSVPGLYFPKRFLGELGAPRRRHEPLTQRCMDIAAGLQEALEDTVMHTLAHMRKETREKDLCMAGGVALNSTMNGRIAASGLFDRIWIHPAAHDAGTCVGAALYGHHNVINGARRFPERPHRYLGPGYSDDAIDAACGKYRLDIRSRRTDDVTGTVARALASGKVVGWYQGRMEWGPRALGNRSILADPRRDDMKDIVNHAVKLREGFRPFAPACLAEEADAWFDMTGLPDSPYMLFVVPVREDKRRLIPAVTHVDGTARVQTVSSEANPRFHALVKAFGELTGVPLVLNTSFNVKGEPIVNTPEDAIRCFLGTGIDMLVMNDTVVEKRPGAATAANRRDACAHNSGRVVDGEIMV